MSPIPDPDSPFAEFARPKESAAEQFLNRKLQDRKSSLARRRFYAYSIGGSSLVAGTAAAMTADLTALIPALGLAVFGSLMGVLVGWVMGVVSWALPSRMIGGWAGMAGVFADRELGLRRENRWDRMTIWMTSWAALGIVAGAAFGGVAGVQLLDEANKEASAWAMIGSTLGFLAGVSLYFVRQRIQGESQANESEA